MGFKQLSAFGEAVADRAGVERKYAEQGRPCEVIHAM